MLQSECVEWQGWPLLVGVWGWVLVEVWGGEQVPPSGSGLVPYQP